MWELKAMIAGGVVFACLNVFISTVELMDIKSAMETETPKQQNRIVQNYQSVPMGQCLSLDLDDDMDHLLDKYNQVFLVMPAKASGTTYKHFTKLCMKSAGTPIFAAKDNIVNDDNFMREAFKHQLELPSLVTSHMYTAAPFKKLIKATTKNTLIIYSHREETARIKSAVKELLNNLCVPKRKDAMVERLENECRVTESKFLERIATPTRNVEVGIGPGRIMGCDVFEKISENSPNLAIVHYKQATKLLRLLSKHHCPEVPYNQTMNVGDKKGTMNVILDGKETNGTIVSIDDWLNAKIEMLEYVWDTRKKDWECMGTLKDIEEELFACPDEALQISGRSYKNQKVTFPLQSKS